ncbi:hypothetical protein B0F90DRAFT_946723 [Multifurca ochricompacta]|uniref:ZP domain-containing protein n=1 Tax=Multifurca ochricompacta TaxID=376703 RepID=A0AAD4M995_9AGAM|nr:hypothetical protein B0F90DRAFT_946723 [Multifurca ochricompacta]
MVDAYHGLAMVPIADAFNHAQDNSVHLQCDYDVCTSCGSLGECPHDAETLEDMDVLATPAGMEDPENTCEMVVNAVVAPGEEVFNTYGATLKNAELLVRYGFMLEANDNDILTWTIEEIWDAAGAVLADPREYCWDKEADYDENRNPLYMTADGALSCKLWLAIALATLKRQGTTIEVAHTRQLLTSMTRAQIQLERRQAVGRSEGDGVDNDAYEALDRLIRTIGELCTRRLDRISRIDVRQQGDHSPGVHSAMVGKYIDNLGTAQRRTQLAVTLALGEISIVESCVAGWDELMAIS